MYQSSYIYSAASSLPSTGTAGGRYLGNTE